MTSKTAIWATKVFIHNDYDSSRSFRPYGQLKIIIRNLVAVGIVIIFCIFFLVPSVQKFGTGAASEGQKISKYTGFRRRSPIIFSALNGIRRKAKNETLPLDYLK
jgi:hypothetical protein